MSYYLRIEFSGLDRLNRTIRELGPSAANRFFPPVLAAGAKVVRRKTRQINFGFTDDTRKLRKSTRIRRVPAEYFGRRYRYGRVSLYAGGRESRQAYLVNVGTKLRTQRSTKRSTGQARARPFIRDAVERTQAEQVSAMANEADKRLRQVIAHARRRGGRSRVDHRSAIAGAIIASTLG